MPTSTQAPKLIDIAGLNVAYPSAYGQVHVINDVALSLNLGDTLGLVGESGCGKSTLAKALMGLLPSQTMISHSKFKFSGQELPAQSSRHWQALRGKSLAMIFQNPMSSLNPYLNIQTQMTEGLKLHFKLNSKTALEKSLVVLEEVMIPQPQNILKKFPHELSGGLCQRVMIAMALSFHPTLLIADEPSTALDVSTQASIMQLLRALQQKRGMSLLLVSHDLALVAQQCQRTAVMYAGEIVEEGPTLEVLNHPLHPYTQCLLAARPKIKGKPAEELLALPGQAPQLRNFPVGCSLATRCPKAMPQCQQRPPRQWVGSQRSFLCHLEPDLCS